jgi:hypothetical protein
MARQAASGWSALFTGEHELAGFDPARLTLRDYNSERALSLRTLLQRQNPGFHGPGVLGELPDGRWAIAAMTAHGCFYTAEEHPPAASLPKVALGPRKVFNGVHFIPLTPEECERFLEIGLRHLTWEEIVRRVQDRESALHEDERGGVVRHPREDRSDGDVSGTSPR